VAARIGCIDRFDGGLTLLRHDDIATIAFWRDRIDRVGGVAKTLEPLCESVCRGLSMQREGCRKTHHADFYTDGLDLTTLRSAYAGGARAPTAQAPQCEIGKPAAGVGKFAGCHHDRDPLTFR